MKRIKKVFGGGDLKRFKKSLKKFQERGDNFVVESKGLSRSIIFDSGIKFKYFPTDKDSKVRGAYFVNMVRKSIDNYIDKNGLLAPPSETPKVVAFNTNAITLAGDEEVLCLDLNSCYRRTANILGYISDELYQKGISSGYKKGLLISIGSLNSIKHIQEYKDGELIRRGIDDNHSRRYAPFYWNIIQKVRDLMMEVYGALSDDFYMWLTDCAFVSPSKEKIVTEIFDKRGYPYKRYTSNFTYCDGYKVSWYDHKSQKNKSNAIASSDITQDYITWKIINDFNTKYKDNEY